MGGMMIFGIVLAVAGLSVALLFDLAATLLIAVGIIVAVVGGAAAVYGGVLEKVWGLALLLLGIVVAVMGVFMSFLLDLWIVLWIIRYGGDDKHIEEMVEEELQSMKKSNAVRRNDPGDIGSHHGGDRTDRNVQRR